MPVPDEVPRMIWHGCESWVSAPVVIPIDLHGCKLWGFAPVDFQIVHHVCKTGLFAHVTSLFERHPKSWIELTQGMGD